MSQLRPRLDEYLLERGLEADLQKAQGRILAGEVFVNEKRVDKAGTRVPKDAVVEIRPAHRYVSRGGEKLAPALSTFSISVDGKVCADVGSSTGGFTDTLLRAGAKRVYAIDTASGELDWK